MPDPFHEPILHFLSGQAGLGLSRAELARGLNIGPEDKRAFDKAVESLIEAGRVVLAEDLLGLPAMGERVTGTFRQTSRGFGFVIPDQANAHGDLFIPAGETGGAISGDSVVAKVIIRPRSDQRDRRNNGIAGRIVEIVKRGTNRAIGTVQKLQGRWVIVPDGHVFRAPIEIPDITAKSATEGDKVVVELVTFPTMDQPATGVITEVLGAHGEPEVELLSVIRQFDLPEAFPEAVMEHARQTATSYDAKDFPGREDLSDELIVTIDPTDARDFDDAISVKMLGSDAISGTDELAAAGRAGANDAAGPAVYELGVHIADVSAFVTAESVMDMEARIRGNSTYFPRKVIPMLPEVLSNGICSLQEAQPRLTKSAFIRYDAQGRVVGTRMANSIIRSRKRLTYEGAQAIIDDAKGEGKPYSKGLLETTVNPNVPEVTPEVRELLVRMDRLARLIQQRRLRQGMIVLDLPEVELVMDESGRVIDAQPEDTSFSHKIIEMFMVEANEAVARFLTEQGLAVLRRIHPEPDTITAEQVRQFALLAGQKVPKVLDRGALQELIDSVRGTPVAFAVHLAVLKTFTTAEYSPLEQGHYALASTNYAHFTSPIRRYADLVIHRALNAVLTGGKIKRRRKPVRQTTAKNAGKRGGSRVAQIVPELLGNTPDFATLVQLGKHLSFTERRSADAERELRQVKVLQLLAEHVGDLIDGVVTGVTGFGVFVQSTRFLTEGLIRIGDLPDDFWQFEERTGVLRGQRTGRKIALGDRARVQIVAVNVPARTLELRMLEHGSSIGGETGMRRFESRGPVKPRAEKDENGRPPRKKNAAKRQDRRKEARGMAARQQQLEQRGGRGRGRGRGKR